MINFSLFVFITLVISSVLIFFYRRAKRKGDIFQSLNMTLFLVLMPKYNPKEDDLLKKEEKQLIAQMEQLYANFLSLHEPIFLRG